MFLLKLLKEKIKVFFLDSVKKNYTNCRPSGLVSRLVLNRKEQKFASPKFTDENFSLATEYVSEFLRFQKDDCDFSSVLFVALFPSTDENHMSNHILKDFISLIEQNNISVWKIFGKRNLEFLNSQINENLELHSKSFDYIWLVSTMDATHEFENQVLKLKRALSPKTKIIYLINDLWREKDFRIFSSKFENADRFFHMDPFAMINLSPEHRQKCHFFPFAGLDQRMFHPDHKKNVIFFSGNINMKYRRDYIDELLSNFRGHNLQVIINAFHYYRRNQVPTMKDYASLLNSSQVCLDLGKKENRYWVLTGRSLEALASGCTLLVDEPISGGPLSLIFNREKDFKSFQTKEQFIGLVKDFDSHPSRSVEIALSGYNEYQRLFDHTRLLSYLRFILQHSVNELRH